MLGMKFKEYNRKTVIISTSVPLWLQVIAWSLGIAIGFGPSTFPASVCTGHCIGCYCLDIRTLFFAAATSFFLIASGMATVTMFDMESKCVLYRVKLYGIIIRSLVMPLDKVKFLGTTRRNKYGDSYRLNILNSNGKQYVIGVFFDTFDYREFLDKLLRFVPIPDPDRRYY